RPDDHPRPAASLAAPCADCPARLTRHSHISGDLTGGLCAGTERAGAHSLPSAGRNTGWQPTMWTRSGGGCICALTKHAHLEGSTRPGEVTKVEGSAAGATSAAGRPDPIKIGDKIAPPPIP